MHGTFKDVHIDKAKNEEVLEKVVASNNGRFDQYSEVKKQFKDIFNADLYRHLVLQDKGEQWTVNTDYNLVAPYIDRNICIGTIDKKNAHKYDFPFLLRRAILGPAMTNQKYNVWQLNYIASRKNLWNFKVEPSKIDNFR